MWPTEVFKIDRTEENLKQLIAEKSSRYYEDFVDEREPKSLVDTKPESV